VTSAQGNCDATKLRISPAACSTAEPRVKLVDSSMVLPVRVAAWLSADDSSTACEASPSVIGVSSSFLGQAVSATARAATSSERVFIPTTSGATRLASRARAATPFFTAARVTARAGDRGRARERV